MHAVVESDPSNTAKAWGTGPIFVVVCPSNHEVLRLDNPLKKTVLARFRAAFHAADSIRTEHPRARFVLFHGMRKYPINPVGQFRSAVRDFEQVSFVFASR